MDFHFRHNTGLLEWHRFSTSDPEDKFKMAELIRYCRGVWELAIYLGSLQSNFWTHKHCFHDDTDNIQYALDHLGNCAYNTNRDMQLTTMIDPMTWGVDLKRATHHASTIATYSLEKYRICMEIRPRDSMWLGNHITTFRRATITPMRMYEPLPNDYSGNGEMQSGMKCSFNGCCPTWSWWDWRQTYNPNWSRLPKLMENWTPFMNC